MDIKTLKSLKKNQIDMLIHVFTPSGCTETLLAAEDVELFIADRDQYSAKFYGVTKEQYQDWIRLHGTARCSAKNKSGNICKYPASRVQLPIKEWLKEDGGLCIRHQRASQS